MRKISFLAAALALMSFSVLPSCTPEEGGSALNAWEQMGRNDGDESENPDDQDKPGDQDNPDDNTDDPVEEPFFTMRGIVLGWSEVSNSSVIDYIAIAKKNGINTFSVYNAPRTTVVWKNFANQCALAGIDLEFEEHMMSYLLPRSLFSTHPEYFRMKADGTRTNDANGCPSSEGALAEVYNHALELGVNYASTNHKYYFWMDDGGDICHCEKCKNLNASDQALIFENKALEALKTIDPEAKLAHLAYSATLVPPTTVEPAEGIFLEFAPFHRSWDAPLKNTWVKGRTGITHAEYLRQLKANLEIFPTETAQVLEYWMDDSLFSNWNESKLVQVPWKSDVFTSDVETYASYGIRSITCYAAYVGPRYVQKFGYPSFLDEYGQTLLNYRSSK